MILRLLRFTADLSNEPKGYYTCLFTVDKKVSPATMRTRNHIINRRPECRKVKDPAHHYQFSSVEER